MERASSGGEATRRGLTMALMPAFPEARHLGPVVRELVRSSCVDQVVVVDDGSKDDTSRVAREAGARVLRHPYNLGYGAALQTGYKYALRSGVQTLVQLDADGQHDPSDVGRLLARLDEEEADLIVGSRFVEQSGYRMSRIRDLGRRAFSALARREGLVLADPTSGFQAMRRPMLELYERDFFPTNYPDIDVLLIAHRKGMRIVEVPVEMHVAPRPSTLHGGFKSVYYVYRLALSLWAARSRTI